MTEGPQADHADCKEITDVGILLTDLIFYFLQVFRGVVLFRGIYHHPGIRQHEGVLAEVDIVGGDVLVGVLEVAEEGHRVDEVEQAAVDDILI